jgi:hypothetical protein
MFFADTVYIVQLHMCIFIEIKYVPVSFLVAVEVRVLGALLGAGPTEPVHPQDVILQKLYKESIRTFNISFTEVN